MRAIWKLAVGASVSVALASTAHAQDAERRFALAQSALRSGEYLEAFVKLKPLADSGDPDALVLLADMYAQGRGVPKSSAEAERLRALAQRARPLAAPLPPGRRLPTADAAAGLSAFATHDYAEAFVKLKPAAEAGDPQAQVRLGDMFAEGLGVPVSQVEARRLYDMARTNPDTSSDLVRVAEARLTKVGEGATTEGGGSDDRTGLVTKGAALAAGPPPLAPQAPPQERPHTDWKKVAVGALAIVAVAALVAAAAKSSGGGGGGGYLASSDYVWRWDQFIDQYGLYEWRCRGVQTGQFADSYHCAGQLQIDSTWPGPY